MERLNFKTWVCGCLASLMLHGSNLFASILTVPFPYPTIQKAINASSNGDTVRVAPGTYVETIDFLGKEITVESTGGASVTTIDANQLDTVVYFWNGETNNSILDGFTLTGGIGYDHPLYGRHGGGMFIAYSNPTIRNCIVVSNSADKDGGGGYVDSSSPIFESCTFSNNASTSWRGGGLFIANSNASLSNCTFTNNSATWGGGLYVFDTISATNAVAIVGCLISENSTSDGAGGLYISQRGGAVISNCNISQNQSGGRAGGCLANGNLAFSNCIIEDNVAGGNGGGLDTAELSGNSPSFTNCSIQNNVSGPGGGGVHAWVDNASVFTRCTIAGNTASTGGGVRTAGCAPTFNGCTIIGNSTTLDISYLGHTGGGIYIAGNPAPIIANCILAGNTAVRGGGVVAVGCDNLITNSIIYANESLHEAGGIFVTTQGNTELRNSIVWGNQDILGTGEVSQIRLENNGATGSIDVSHSIIEHWSGNLGGSNNRGLDPRWVSPFGTDGIAGTLDDDLHLHPTSPCIDAGDNANAYGMMDIDGDARFLDDPYTEDTGNGTAPIVDIGPDEFVVATIGDAGARLWMDSGMCMFEDTDNWLPGEVPDFDNLAMFEVLGEANVCLSGDATVEQLIIANGDVYLDLGGMTLTSLEEVLVAPFGGKIANLTVSGGFFGARNGSDMGTLVFDSLVVGGGGIGSFNLDENVNLMANEFMMQYGASIDGEPTISSDIQNFGGRVRPGTSEFFDPFDVGVPGSMVIDGDFVQVGIPAIGSLPRYGSMEFDIEPESFEIPHDTLTVTGHVTLGGILELNFETSYVDVGDSFDLISAQSVSGEFNLLWTRGLQDGEVARIEDQIGLSGNGDDITIGETNDIQFGAVGLVTLLNSSGSPTDFLVVDLDGQGGLDAVVSRIGTSPQGTGVIEIYYDIYNNDPSSTTSISVGRNPQGLVADDFDGDGDVDLAVVNTNDDSMSILTNNGTTFSAQTIQVVDEPVDLAVGDFISSTPLPDLAVASSSANSIEIYENTSVLLAVGFQFKSANFAGTPGKINPGDVNNDKDFDLIVISSGDDTTFDMPGDGDGGVTPLQVVGTPSATRVPVGIDPLEFAVGDMNGDGLDDTIIINGDESVSVRLDTSDVAATVTLGAFPRGISVGDLDNDGDNDVVITALDPNSFDRDHGEQSVIIIRNDTVESSTITLTDLGTIGAGGGVSGSLIDLGDVNEDGLLDIIAVTESGGVAELIEYWLNASPSSTCVGDFDGNGEVRVNDLLYLISAWGDQGGDADLDGNGIVAVADLLILISNWGPCT